MPPLDSNGLLPHDSDAARPPAPRPAWKDRLGTYLIGVGIGVVLVVMFIAARSASKGP